MHRNTRAASQTARQARRRAPGLLVRTERDRAFLAVADGRNPVRRNAQAGEIVLRRVRPPLAEREVVFASAALVAIAFERDPLVRIALQPLHLRAQRGRVGIVDVVLVGVEIDHVLPVHLGDEIGIAARDGRVRNFRRRLAFLGLRYVGRLRGKRCGRFLRAPGQRDRTQQGSGEDDMTHAKLSFSDKNEKTDWRPEISNEFKAKRVPMRGPRRPPAWAACASCGRSDPPATEIRCPKPPGRYGRTG